MTRLTVHPVPADGPEDVVVLTDGPHAGSVVTGTADGSLWRLSPDGTRVERIARTGGRPLGIELLGDALLVCDVRRGLLRVDPGTGAVDVLLDRVDGRPMRFCNNAAVAADGTIWFTDSSARFGVDRWRDEFVHDTRTGRLLRLDPGADEAVVVLQRLRFANGVALGPEEDYVAVAETSGRSVVRRWLTGPRTGSTEPWLTDLPGYPDNLARGSDGLLWVTIASPTSRLVEALLRAPGWLRRQATRIPERLQPGPARSVRVQAYDDDGRLVHDLDGSALTERPAYAMVTGVREHAGRVWLGSLEQAAVAVWDR